MHQEEEEASEDHQEVAEEALETEVAAEEAALEVEELPEVEEEVAVEVSELAPRCLFSPTRDSKVFTSCVERTTPSLPRT